MRQTVFTNKVLRRNNVLDTFIRWDYEFEVLEMSYICQEQTTKTLLKFSLELLLSYLDSSFTKSGVKPSFILKPTLHLFATGSYISPTSNDEGNGGILSHRWSQHSWKWRSVHFRELDPCTRKYRWREPGPPIILV